MLPLILTLVFGVVIIQTKPSSRPVVKHFPLVEKEDIFQTAETSLTLRDRKLGWKLLSRSYSPQYLRQDMSLLFLNGFLKGAMNEWKNNSREIKKITSLPLHQKDKGKWEAISFHHAEIHNDTIHSAYTLSGDTVYTGEGSPEQWEASTEKRIRKEWDRLLEHFNIDSEDYYEVPLTDVELLEDRLSPLPEQTRKAIISRLWEGVYKEFVLPSLTSDDFQSVVPLLLLDKKQTHLLVLFTGEDKREQQLIQYYDGASSS